VSTERLHPLTRLRILLLEDLAHGPLPVLLLGLTVVTGVIDAVSILRLGRVFVANMTGNVVFIAFGIAGAKGFSVQASLCALAGFLIGAAVGGRLARQLGDDRIVLLRAGVALELTLVVCALAIALGVGSPLGAPATDGIAIFAASAMGIQNAVARHLRIVDLTTTVLTLTLAGIAIDVSAEHRIVTIARRVLAVLAMFVGAICGALLVLHSTVAAGLGLACAVLACVLVGSHIAARTPAEWRAQPT
jgi:uncharacterized membrane protein YoaK (UPF0700 family)